MCAPYGSAGRHNDAAILRSIIHGTAECRLKGMIFGAARAMFRSQSCLLVLTNAHGSRSRETAFASATSGYRISTSACSRDPTSALREVAIPSASSMSIRFNRTTCKVSVKHTSTNADDPVPYFTTSILRSLSMPQRQGRMPIYLSHQQVKKVCCSHLLFIRG